MSAGARARTAALLAVAAVVFAGCGDDSGGSDGGDSGGAAPKLDGRGPITFVSGKDTGLGLGLVISQRIAQDHGGRIDAANRPGGGASFVVTLPTGAPGEE